MAKNIALDLPSIEINEVKGKGKVNEHTQVADKTNVSSSVTSVSVPSYNRENSPAYDDVVTRSERELHTTTITTTIKTENKTDKILNTLGLISIIMWYIPQGYLFVDFRRLYDNCRMVGQICLLVGMFVTPSGYLLIQKQIKGKRQNLFNIIFGGACMLTEIFGIASGQLDYALDYDKGARNWRNKWQYIMQCFSVSFYCIYAVNTCLYHCYLWGGSFMRKVNNCLSYTRFGARIIEDLQRPLNQIENNSDYRDLSVTYHRSDKGNLLNVTGLLSILMFYLPIGYLFVLWEDIYGHASQAGRAALTFYVIFLLTSFYQLFRNIVYRLNCPVAQITVSETSMITSFILVGMGEVTRLNERGWVNGWEYYVHGVSMGLYSTYTAGQVGKKVYYLNHMGKAVLDSITNGVGATRRRIGF